MPKSSLIRGVFVYLLLSFSVYAAEGDDVHHYNHLVHVALEHDLAHSPVWLKLIHYEPSLMTKTGWESAIHSPEFFLSSEGHQDPEKELKATLRGMLQARVDNPDEHTVCRFPARTSWLRKQLAIPSEWGAVKSCPEFDNWSFKGTTDSISIVFATGYLGNPASYYGHTLLKLNSSLQRRQTTLLDVSVNYGAIVPENEDPLTYIVKGVTGGYKGGFSHIQYYFHTHNYGENELRDLWEYQLNLPQEAVELVVAHAWEVLGREYTYYFFRKNCAYRMAELIQVVEGVDIIPQHRPFTLPQSLISKLGRAKLNAQPLVDKVIYHPSRQSRLYRRFSSLSKQEQERVRTIIEQDSAHLGQAQALSYAEVDTLLDYYQYIIKSDSDGAETAQERYRQALLQRYLMPPQGRQGLEPRKPSPDLSRRPSRVELSRIYSSRAGSGWGVQLRPAYYDPLDSDDAHVSNSTLAMGELALQVFGQEWRVDRFDLVTIESANTQVTGLPGDSREAWRLKAGWVRPDLACGDCLAPRVEGSWGRSFAPRKYLNVTALVGAALQDKRHGQALVDATLGIRAVSRFSREASVLLERVVRTPIADAGHTQREDQVALRYALGANADVRLGYRSDGAEEVSLGLGVYF